MLFRILLVDDSSADDSAGLHMETKRLPYGRKKACRAMRERPHRRRAVTMNDDEKWQTEKANHH